MANVTIGLGVALILLGVVGYAAADPKSATALIPAAFGVVFLLLGVLALKEGMRKHAMHVAAALGLLGFLGGVRGFGGLATLLSGGTVERPLAAISQSVLAILCLGFVLLCVRSFVAARRARSA